MMTQDQNIIEIVNELQKFQIEISVDVNSYNHLQKSLSDSINHLIANDFSRLISILYRLDISEKKLKQLLKNSGDTPSGDIIAKMIIERQLQKIEIRKSFTGNTIFSNEEKW